MVTDRPPGANPGLLIYIMVDDVAATTKASLNRAAKSCNQSAWMHPKSQRDFVIRQGIFSAFISSQTNEPGARRIVHPCLNCPRRMDC
jgi:hypothetical protein